MEQEKAEKKTVLILSGGMDSSTLLYYLLSEGFDVSCISFNYGQRHVKELHSAKDIAFKAQQKVLPMGLNVHHEIIDLTGFRNCFAGSSQTDPRVEVPKGHYEDESMKATVVPNRNMIMLSIAAAHAISFDINSIAYGAHAGDHAIYPDCRPEFIERMQSALLVCHYTPIRLYVPFKDMNKVEILETGLQLQVPYELTWTCYEGMELSCGHCGCCVERLEAFKLNKERDPLKYENQQ